MKIVVTVFVLNKMLVLQTITYVENDIVFEQA